MTQPPAPSGSARKASHRLDGLDGLRTIAVFLVILFHVGTPYMAAGYIGVDMFFVLSGFLITSGLVRELDRSGHIDLGKFWTRRIKRLMPAAIVVILVVLAWAFFGADLYRRPSLAGDAFFTSIYVANWHFIGSASYFSHDGTTSPLLHMWSLAVEEQFYVAWPLLLFGLWVLTRRRGGRARFHVLAAVITAVLVSTSAVLLAVLWQPAATERAYMGTDSKIFEPLLGAAVAIAMTSPSIRHFTERWGGWLAAGGLLLTIPVFAVVDGPAELYFKGGALVFSILIALAIAGLAQAPNSPVARLLGLAPMAYLGRISYGLYLWHWPFAVWLGTHMGRFQPGRAALVVALTVAAAALSYHLLEMPIREGRLSHWLSVRRTLTAGAATVLVPVLIASTMGGTPLSPLFRGLHDTATDPDVMLVVGDSVPQRMLPAIAPAAEARGLQTVTATAGGCSPLAVHQDIGRDDKTGAKCPAQAKVQVDRVMASNAGVVLWWSRYEIADRYRGRDLLSPPGEAFWRAQQADFRSSLDRLMSGGATVVVVLTEPPGMGMKTRCKPNDCHPFLERMVVNDDYRTRWNGIVLAEAKTNPRLKTISMDDVLCTTPPVGGSQWGSSLCDDMTSAGKRIRPDGSHVDLPTAGDAVATRLVDRVLAALGR